MSGKLEPIHFSIVSDADKQVVNLYSVKSGHTYQKSFDPGTSVEDMLSDIKLDLFTVQP